MKKRSVRMIPFLVLILMMLSIVSSGCISASVAPFSSTNLTTPSVTLPIVEITPGFALDSYGNEINVMGSANYTTIIMKIPLEAKGYTDNTQAKLEINYGAQVLIKDFVVISRVQLKVDGAVWQDSGAISLQDYSNTCTRQIQFNHTYKIRVEVSTAEGATYSAEGTFIMRMESPK